MKIIRGEPLHAYHLYNVSLDIVDRFFWGENRSRCGFNRRMFNDDFSQLLHWIDYSGGRLFNVVSNDDELSKKILGEQGLFDKVICELMEEVVKSLVWDGGSYFFVSDSKEKGVNITSFSLRGVLRFFGAYFQWVPKRREMHCGLNMWRPRELRILDATKIMHFEMPCSIKRILSAQNRTLELIDKYKYGYERFNSQATYENPNPANYFNFRVWNDTQDYALYRTTRKTGWNGRMHDSKKQSEFFDCHRLIRFRRCQLLLRDDILNQIGRELSRVGQGYSAEFSVKILMTDELPTVAHLNELEMKLAREEVSFNEVIDYCMGR